MYGCICAFAVVRGVGLLGLLKGGLSCKNEKNQSNLFYEVEKMKKKKE